MAARSINTNVNRSPVGDFDLRSDDLAGRPNRQRPAFVSLGCPAATLLLGDFSLMTVGFWGVGPTIEATEQASASLFAVGMVSFRVLIGVDIALRAPAAFNVISSIT